MNKYLWRVVKLLVYFMVMNISFSNTVVSEVFKVPFLAIHYQDHQQRNPGIGIIGFLAMHYWGRDINDHDAAQDLKLPFKKIFHGHTQVLFYNPQGNTPLTHTFPFLNTAGFTYLDQVTFSMLTKRYRPPQFPSIFLD